MPITRTPIIDDDGSGTTGTVIDNAWKQQFYDQIDALVLTGQATTVPLSTPGTYQNLALPATPVVVVHCSATVTIGGFSLAREGQRVFIRNGGLGQTVTLLNASESSTAALYNFAISAPTRLEYTGAAVYVCVAGFYVLASHQQGARTAVPYSAANYQNFTVEASDVVAHHWQLEGRYLQMDLAIATATIAAGIGQLNVAGWPYTFAAGIANLFGWVNTGAGWQSCLVLPSGASLAFFLAAGGNYPANTNTTALHLSARIFVN